MNKVIKRDGRTVRFDRERIINAVKRAFEATEGETFDDYALNKANHIADYVEKYINEQSKNVSVENIQDIVEKGLMSCKKKDVAKEYILYREKRTRERDRNSKFRHVIKTKLMATDVQNQNANVDEYSFGGRTGEAASELNRQVALDEVISPMARRNHLNNEIYEHDLDHFVLGDHNCFKKNTKFITNYGIKTFESFRDGDKIKVLNKYNKWVDATVHYYGKQKMQVVTLSRCGIKKEVGCTPNHRWVLSDGTVTDNLQVGDRLYPLNEYKEPKLESLRDYEMFAYGFLLGDGCDHRCKNIDNIQVRLCDKKNKYGYIFEQAKYHKQNIKNSNDVVYTKRTTVKKQDFLDNKIWNILSLKDKINLFNGFYAADGNQTTHTKTIYTSDDRILNMIKDISALAGYHIYKIKTIIHNTEYKQNAKLYEIIFTVKYSINSTWKVENIEMRSHNKFEAWCIDEPKTHSFMLDGGIITGNCLSVPFDDILKNGFNVKQTDVRPANSVNTAFQLVAVIFQIQSLNQFGGVSATHIDWTMIPYVRKSFMKHYITAMLKDTDDFAKLNLMQMLFETYKEPVYGRYTVTRDKFDDWVDEHKEQILKDNNLTQDDFYFDNENLNSKYKQSAMFDTIKETYQAVEGLFHNLNTLQSRSGNQLPFTSINYGTCTITEGRLITKAILDTSIKGVGKLHRTAVFPCQIFQCMKGVNRQKGDPNYDLYQLAIKSTTKRLYPNYCNVDWSVNKGYDRNNPEEYVATMGCRTYNGYDMNGFGQMKDGRGNICPVTIILPTLAMESKGEVGHKDVEDFMKILDKKIHEAKIMLEERFNYICSQDPASAKFMYENGTMRGYVPEEGIISAMKHGTLAVGQLGLAEALQILIDTNQCTERGMELAKRIEQLFKDRCNEFKHELHHLDNGYEYYLNYGVYYTPAENLCYKAMKAFKKKYGVIPKISDKDFMSNSMHVPVWEVMNPFQKIDIESQLTGYSSAGCITYVELDANAKINLKAVETIINYAMDKDIPYFAINVPADTCMDCGYEDEIADTCPNCGGHHIQHLRRVTGYLTGDYMSSFNKGKQDEVRHRYKHSHSLSMNTWKEEQ